MKNEPIIAPSVLSQDYYDEEPIYYEGIPLHYWFVMFRLRETNPKKYIEILKFYKDTEGKD